MNILTTEEKHRLLSDISTLRAHVIDVARKFDGAGQILSMCNAADDIVIVAHDVAERQAQHEARGISDAF